LLTNDGALLIRKIVRLTEDESFLTDKTRLLIDATAPLPDKAVSLKDDAYVHVIAP